jgi:hypothetical protein
MAGFQLVQDIRDMFSIVILDEVGEASLQNGQTLPGVAATRALANPVLFQQCYPKFGPLR